MIFQRTRLLRESRRQLRMIAHSAQDAIIVIEASGAAVFWNPAATRMFGYTPEEVWGKDIQKLLTAPRYETEYSAELKKYLEMGDATALGQTVEIRAVRKNGEEIPIELSLSPATMNDQRYAIAVARDITARNRPKKPFANTKNVCTPWSPIFPGPSSSSSRAPNGELDSTISTAASETSSA